MAFHGTRSYRRRQRPWRRRVVLFLSQSGGRRSQSRTGKTSSPRRPCGGSRPNCSLERTASPTPRGRPAARGIWGRRAFRTPRRLLRSESALRSTGARSSRGKCGGKCTGGRMLTQSSGPTLGAARGARTSGEDGSPGGYNRCTRPRWKVTCETPKCSRGRRPASCTRNAKCAGESVKTTAQASATNARPSNARNSKRGPTTSSPPPTPTTVKRAISWATQDSQSTFQSPSAPSRRPATRSTSASLSKPPRISAERSRTTGNFQKRRIRKSLRMTWGRRCGSEGRSHGRGGRMCGTGTRMSRVQSAPRCTSSC
mmetsp:Transcript_27059/g.61674  ORF Transcript_27059/g.61674 Transcript_27059/m.61674 type:complete len:313 (+) Transcript_27059:323-1261(+)